MDETYPEGQNQAVSVEEVNVTCYTWDDTIENEDGANGNWVETDEEIITVEGSQQDGWVLVGEGVGKAVVTLSYERVDGDNSESGTYEFVVYGGGGIFNYEWLPMDNAQMLTDDNLTVSGRLGYNWYHDEEDCGFEWLEDYSLEVNSECEYDTDLVTAKITEDGRGLWLTSNENQDGETDVWVKVKYGDEYVADAVFHIWVCDDSGYYAIVPQEYNNSLPVGASFDLNLGTTDEPGAHVYRYWRDENVIKSEPLSGEDITVELAYDETEWRKTGETGSNGLPVLQRICDCDTCVTLIAKQKVTEEEDGEEICRYPYWFDSLDYSIWFDGDQYRDENGNTWLYDDAELTLSLDTGNLADKGNFYRINWTVGIWDENGGEPSEPDEDCYEVSDDGKNIILDGEKLREWIDEDTDAGGFDVGATVTVGDDILLSETSIYVDTWDSVYEYGFEYDRDNPAERFPDNNIWIDNTVSYHESSQDHASNIGEELWDETAVTDVSVKITEGASKAITCREEEDGWELELHSICEAEVTVKYEDYWTHEEIENVFPVSVVGEQYYIDLAMNPDNPNLIPGDTFTITAKVVHDIYGGDGSEEDKEYRLKWSAEGNVTLNASEGTVITATAGEVGDAAIFVKAYKGTETEPIKEERIDLNIKNYQIQDYDDTPNPDQYLIVNESFSPHPALYEQVVDESESENKALYKGEIRYWWEYDDNYLEISSESYSADEGRTLENQFDNDGRYVDPGFSLTRLREGWTEATLIAEIPQVGEDGKPITDDAGDPIFTEVARRTWSFIDPDFHMWIEGERGDGYTWVFCDENAVFEAGVGEGLLENGRILEWTVGLYDEDTGEFTQAASDTYAVDSDNGLKLTLCGKEMQKWLDAQGYNSTENENPYPAICASVMAPAGENTDSDEVYRYQIAVEIKDPVVEWQDQNGEVLVGDHEAFYYDQNEISCYIENGEYPYGKNLIYTVVVIESDNEVLSPGTTDDDQFWYVAVANDAVAGDTATLTYQVRFKRVEGEGNVENGNETSFTSEVTVHSTLYGMSVTRSTGMERMLPGSEQILQVLVYRIEALKQEDGTIAYLRAQMDPETDYEAEFLDWDENMITVTKDGHITASSSEDSCGETWLRVHVTIPQEGEKPYELWSDEPVYIEDYYYMIEAKDCYSAVPGVGSSIYIKPILKMVDADTGNQEVQGTLSAELYDTNHEGLVKFEFDTNTVTVTQTGTVGEDADPLCGVVKLIMETVDDYGYPVSEEFYCSFFFCDHTYEDDPYQIIAWPGCETDGKKVKICDLCGCPDFDNMETISALGHDWSDWEIVTEATCTEAGLRERRCDRCDSVEQGEIAATGHKYTAAITRAATCTATGVKTYTCSSCGDTYTESIPVTDHSPIFHPAVEETCTAAGNVAYYHCSVCGKNYSDKACTKELTDVTVAAAHELTSVSAVDATCTAAGNRKYYHCSVCGKNYSDANGKTEVTSVAISAKGHNYTAKITKAATCTAAGVRTYTCSNCGDEYTETIPAGHTLSHMDATADTVEHYHCSVCDKNFSDASGTAELTSIAAPAEPASQAEHIHTWGEWTTISEATVFAPEEQQRTCSTCGASETQTVGEALARTITVPATSLKMQVKQKTTKFVVTGMAKGDSVVSMVSDNTKRLKVTKFSADGTCTLKAGTKTGKATLTITLASGLTKTVTFKIQKAKVKTTSVKVAEKKLTLQRGKKLALEPLIKPIMSQDKVKYTSSNKKIATVSSKGKITAKKAGKVKITIKSGKKKVVCTVTVTK